MGKANGGHLDHLTEIIGPFGLFHAVVYTTLGLSISLHCWQSFANKFYTYPTDFWCAKPQNLANLTLQEWKNLSAPMNDDGQFDNCHIFDVNYDAISTRPTAQKTPIKKCQHWEYDAHHFDVNLVFKKFVKSTGEIIIVL